MPLDAQAIATLKTVSTATITTVLLKKGLRNVWIRGAKPIRTGQPRLVGPAFTLRFVPAREDLATPATGSIALNVNAVNDAPLLTPASPVLPPLTEDDTTNAGQTVASFRGAIADVVSGTQPGIVITATDNGNGHWEYRIGSGSWTSSPAS